MNSSNKKIVITGIGPIASPGIGRDQLWSGLNSRNTGVIKIKSKIGKTSLGDFYMHKVDNFDIKNFDIDKNCLDFINSWKGGDDVDLNYMLASVKLALDDGRISYKDNNSLGLIVVHENPSLEKLLWGFFNQALNTNLKTKNKNILFDNMYRGLVKTAYETQSFMLLFHIAKVFNIKNYSLYINNACASGLYALEVASDIIKSGKASQIVIVAGDCPTYLKHLWFKSLNMYPADGKTKPFSKFADGFLLGEGAVAIVVEDYATAKKRKAKIYVEYAGGGFALDSWKITVPAVHDSSLERSIEQALRNARCKSSQIDLICAHGVGTSLNDKYEAKVINKIFASAPVVTALKSYVGHNLGGSALLELAILLLMIEKNKVLPLFNFNSPSELIENINLAKNVLNKKTNVAMKICSAFAGYNAATIFRKIT